MGKKEAEGKREGSLRIEGLLDQGRILSSVGGEKMGEEECASGRSWLAEDSEKKLGRRWSGTRLNRKGG